MTELLANVVERVAANAYGNGDGVRATSSTESYHPLFSGSPESSSRVTLADTKTPGPVALAMYRAACDVAVQVVSTLGPSCRFPTVGSNDFLNDLVDIANYERECTGTKDDDGIPVPAALRAGSTQAVRLQAVLDHLTDTFVRFAMPVMSAPGLANDTLNGDWYVNMAKIRRAAREAAVMVLRHLSGADRLGPVAPAAALGTSHVMNGSRASSGNANDDLVRQTVQSIRFATSQVGFDAGIF